MKIVLTLTVLILIGALGCGPAGDKTLSADILLPSEVQGLQGSSLVLTMADTTGQTVVVGPTTLTADSDGLYPATLGKLPKGDYMTQVAIQVPHTQPQLSSSLPVGLEVSDSVTVAYAVTTLPVSGSKTVLLSFKPADFAFNLDPDGDSLFSLNEYLSGTDPMNADTDGDGVPDFSDTFTLDVSEWLDEDQDKIGNNHDNCISIVNLDQKDSDGDRKGDVCDTDNDNDGLTDEAEAALGSDPFDADSDDDGVGDATDNCILTANADQTDSDSDGSGNDCDTNDDKDTLPDTSDNCPITDNEDQADANADGIGDACTGDDDGDGVADDADNCRLVSNPLQTDTDGDATGDACDTDDDNDGLTDAEETGLGLDHLTTNPLAADTDGDGLGDSSDNCPLATNVTQTDTDNDGEGDACDCALNDDQIRIRNAIFVSTSGLDSNNGSLNDPVKSIAHAIDLAKVSGSAVYVTAGTYNESVTLVSGVSIYGGFAAGSSCLRDLVNNTSRITSTASVTLTGTDIANETTLDGLTIENNDPSGSSSGTSLLITSTTSQATRFVTVRNSQIFGPDNSLGASFGVRVSGASPLFVNDVIYGGASLMSEAVVLENSPATKLYHNTIRGGASADTATPRAFTSTNSVPTLVNNILTTDLGSTDQRLILINDATLSPQIVIQGNLLVGESGGFAPKLYWDKVGGVRMSTSIEGVNELDPDGVLAGDGIENNLSSADPSALFKDYANHDYHLANGSAAIGAGIDPASVGLGVTTDIEGVMRVGHDIGAYEY